MKSRSCSQCGLPFASERSGAGPIRSEFCSDCLEEKLSEKNAPHREVRESWFQLFALDPPPAFFEREIDLDEWRTCTSCGRRFKTHPDIHSELCPPCLEERWEAAPLEPSDETPISPEHARALLLFKGKKGEKALK